MKDILMNVKELVNNPKNRWVIWVVIIVLVSVKIISNAFSLNYTSETALHVLMINDFEFLKDNFIWGETYLGSLFPMIGSVISFFVEIPSLYMSTILQYVFLITLYVVLCKTFVFDNTLRVFLTFIVFIPPQNYIQLVYPGFSYLSSLPAFFIATLYLFRVYENIDSDRVLRYLGLYFSFSFLSGWVMEFFIYFTYMTSLIVLGFVIYKRKSLSVRGRRFLIPAIIIGNLLIFYLMKYLKSVNRSQFYQEGFNKLNNVSEAITVIKTYMDLLIESLKFNGNLISSLYSYSFILIATFFIICVIKNFKELRFDMKFLFLIYLLGTYCGAVIISNWNYFMGIHIKYLTPAYFIIGILVCYTFSKLFTVKSLVFSRSIVYVVIGFFVISGSLTEILYIIKSEDLRVSAHTINKQLKEKGLQDKMFYAGYYHAYKISGATSGVATGTVSGKTFGNFRNFKMRTKVMESAEIYVVPNGLFGELPDTLHDFGINLVKSKERPILIDGWDETANKKDGFIYDMWILQKYNNISINDTIYSKIFDASDLHSWQGKREFDEEVKKEVWKLDLNNVTSRQSASLVFSRLEFGKYKCSIHMSISDSSAIQSDNLLQLNVMNELTKQTISDINIPKSAIRNGYWIYDLEFNVGANTEMMLISLSGDKTDKPCLLKVKKIEIVKK